MGLSYASQLGGSITIMGSSTTMMAKESVKNFFDMPFFGPTKVAIILLVLTSIIVGLLAPTPLLKSSSAAQKDNNDAECPSTPTRRARAYEIVFQVQKGGALDGAKTEHTISNLGRLPGVFSISPERSTQIEINTRGEMSMNSCLAGGTKLLCHATADGVVCLRRTRGLQLACQQEVEMLGSRRRERNLRVRCL
jgi:hypothetical protein